ncbi:MAG: Gfo/Idh/MocA family oxidoreductase [Planctomycetes bacterium]|nr:Gfo/Idh/MocA family oxidoreductase [Planctomycetota bacterium]
MTVTKAPLDQRRQLNVGMLGCGFMGKCHSNAFRKMPYIYPGASFVPRLLVLCGRDEAKLRREALRYGFEEHTADWRDVVRDPRVDVFDNCGPDPLHVEPSIEALKQGKHVICEKPLAVSLQDARRMRDAAAAAKGRNLCVFNYRFVPAVLLAKEIIASGQIGQVYQARMSYLQEAGHDPSTPPEQVWYARWPHSGVLQGIGSHAIDQVRYLVGEVRSASGAVRTYRPERAVASASDGGAEADEASASVLELEGGAIAVVEASAVATGRKNFLAWEIHGSRGSLRWDLEHPNSLFACLPRPGAARLEGFAEISVTGREYSGAAEWWPPGHNVGWEHCHVIEKLRFLEACTGSPMDPAVATFEDGYRVAAVIAAIRRSSRTGERVALEY